MTYIQAYLKNLTEKISILDEKKIYKAVKLLKKINRKSKIIIIGNGGSSALASHVSIDFTKICKIRAIAFSDVDLITCFANDYGHSNWMKEAFEAYYNQNDLLICVSSSGMSENIIRAAKAAKKKRCKIITFTGFSKNNKVGKLGDLNFWVDSKNYNIVEMTHHCWLLSIVDYIAKSKI
jgi:D-sedoheptulose 7-phosphate isomerase